MPLPADVTIEHVEQYLKPTAYGPPTKVMRVSYRVGSSGPFSEDFAEADYNAAAVEQRIGAVAETTRQLVKPAR